MRDEVCALWAMRRPRSHVEADLTRIASESTSACRGKLGFELGLALRGGDATAGLTKSIALKKIRGNHGAKRPFRK
jgi:hypothetical protein